MRDIYGRFVEGHKQLNTGRTWIKKGTTLRKGSKHTQLSKDKMSRAKKGIMPSNIEFIRNYQHPRGENHYLWKGTTPIYRRMRKSKDFKLWRGAVFIRDNYTCQKCGERGGELHPDHIKQFAYHSELRFVIDNGRTLCVSCHRKTPTYGRKKHLCC